MIERAGTLREGLAALSDKGVHPAVARLGWREITTAARDLALGSRVPCDEEPGILLRDIALRSSRHSDPEPRDRDNELYGRGVRAQAAQLLLALARHPTCRDGDVRARLLALAEDASADVRHALAFWLNTIADWTLFWEIAERFANREEHGEVVAAFLHALWQAGPPEVDRAVHIVEQVLSRPVSGNEKVEENATAVLLRCYVRSESAGALTVLRKLADDPAAHHNALRTIFTILRYDLVWGLTIVVRPPDASVVRHRAQQLFEFAANQCVEKMLAMEDELKAAGRSPNETEVAQMRELARLINTAAHEILFAWEADADRGGGPLTPEGRATFFLELRGVVETIGRWAHPAVAHTLLDLVGQLIEVNPRATWPLFLQIVQAGVRRGYQAESLAEQRMDEFVRIYLRKYRRVVEEELSSHAVLVDVLDAFVGMGWPSARRLTYQLDELFR